MELIGKLEGNNTTNIGMTTSASKYISIKFADQCLYIINNKERLNIIKGSTKMQKRKSQFKYQPHILNVQRNSDVDHRGTKMRRNNKLLTSLNVINCKTLPYASKGILRHYHYRSDPKLVPSVFSIRSIPCSCYA